MTAARVEPPDSVVGMVRRLEESGFETWTVGGAVRDALLDRRSATEDWDLATRATPRQVRRLFRRTVPLGIEYGTVGVLVHDRDAGRDVVFEVTTFRHDVITYGRRAVVSFATTLEEDLARRDFTVNAMAWHPLRRELRDPHGGRDDLDDGVLRTVGPPAERFREDYLRVLRGLRFAGGLDLKIAPETWQGMMDAVDGLSILSRERVREELVKVLGSRAPSRSLTLYEQSGARRAILPELEPWTEAALRTVDAVRGRRMQVRMGALLLEGLGADRTRRAEIAERLLTGLRFSNADVQRIVAVAGGAPAPDPELTSNPGARRRWRAELGRQGVRDAIRLWMAALRASPDEEGGGPSGAAQDQMVRLVRALAEDRRQGIPWSIGGLALGGRDLIAMGWEPGPALGRALRRLMEAVWDGRVANRRAPLVELAYLYGAESGDRDSPPSHPSSGDDAPYPRSC